MQENEGITSPKPNKFIYQIFENPDTFHQDEKDYFYLSEKTNRIYNKLRKNFNFQLMEKIDEAQISRKTDNN
jgi:hypothetical protein